MADYLNEKRKYSSGIRSDRSISLYTMLKKNIASEKWEEYLNTALEFSETASTNSYLLPALMEQHQRIQLQLQCLFL